MAKTKGVTTRKRREAVPYNPTERYETRQVEGWTVLINRGLLEAEPALAGSTLELLRHQLYQVGRRVPAGPLERLRSIRIWVEEQEPHTPCMTYHPGRPWLRRHGINPEKARCVELANARNFLLWTIDQPWMVLHELAHGYHHQYLDGGFANAPIRAAYKRACADKRYDAVSRINGHDGRAYAVTNVMEYFAEGSEAFFGTNDFYPYVRSELARHDPDLFTLLKQFWDEQRD
jgi:hypothetical protein